MPRTFPRISTALLAISAISVGLSLTIMRFLQITTHTLASPDWKKFVLYNALGAATWATSMSLIGYAFANEFQTLLGYVEKMSWVMAGGLFALGYFLWRRQKKRFQERQRGQKAA